jgi:hypothetical protein
MAVVIREIVSEVVLGPPPPEEAAGGAETVDRDELIETIVRRATARVVDLLRREWDG